MQPERLLSTQMILGEGPVWDHHSSTLYWVDITAGQLWRYALADGKPISTDLGQSIGACCLTQSGGMLLALEKSIELLEGEKRRVLVDGIELDKPQNRLNDGKCDPQGRFLIGSMDRNAAKGQGALYRFNPDGQFSTLLSGVSISNGLDWSPDGKHLYYVDTPCGMLWRFDYDAETGDLSNRTALIDYTKEEGSFDGLCVDAEGYLWVCHWGGFQVSRWNPHTGKKIASIRLPVPNVTCCSFGGAAMNQLFITTGVGMDAKVKQDYPLSGSIYVCEVDAVGRQPNRFAL